MVEKRSIGDSGIEVAPLALGGNVFGWTADEKASFAVLDAFVEAGGTMIDTADVYSAWVPGHRGGESEEMIGRWLRRDPAKRSRIVIATKVGFTAGLAPESIAPSCDASLRRLGIEEIDLYYQHKDDERVPLAESLAEFDRLKKAGKIRAIGLSNFSAARIDDAFDAALSDGLTAPVALQPFYNLVAREFENELQGAAARHRLGVFPYQGLASGFLTGKYRSGADLRKSPRGKSVERYLEGNGTRVLDTLDEIATETGASLATISLAWLMAQPMITAPIASATNVDQLKQLTAAMDLTLSLDQIARLDEASAERETAAA
ncbi:MAG TPA: aldo/keto reductase [Sphingomicrobium sp.]|jgi:aryl-alcohol dehydrogenase-like predicted oxidoreductase|nr:aldo/keto reductase [Sphingomicrobium sp.]